MKYFIGSVIYFTIAVITTLIYISFDISLKKLVIVLIPLIPIVFCGIDILEDSPSKGKTTITEKDLKIFKECWLFTDFMKQHGKIIEIKEFTNNCTGKKFKTCIFKESNGNRQYLSFTTSLGELTIDEIYRKKNELKVGLTYRNNYKLFNDSIEEWETVDFNSTTGDSPQKEELISLSSTKDRNDYSYVIKESTDEINISLDEKKKGDIVYDEYIEKLNHKIAESLKEKGIYLDEEAIKEKYQELRQTIYDGSEDYEVNLLTREQKCALFGLIALMGAYKSIEQNKEQADEIVKDFADTLSISDKDYKEITNNARNIDRYDCTDVIKNIKLDFPVNMLFDAWRDLVALEPPGKYAVAHRLRWASKEIGFTYDEYLDIKKGMYVHKYS